MVQLLLVDTENNSRLYEREKKHDDFIIQITIILTLHLKHFKEQLK